MNLARFFRTLNLARLLEFSKVLQRNKALLAFFAQHNGVKIKAQFLINYSPQLLGRLSDLYILTISFSFDRVGIMTPKIMIFVTFNYKKAS